MHTHARIASACEPFASREWASVVEDVVAAVVGGRGRRQGAWFVSRFVGRADVRPLLGGGGPDGATVR